MSQSHGHSQKEIENRIANPPGRGLLRDIVYGGIDGSVTTFAIVAGVAGAGFAGLAHICTYSGMAGGWSLGEELKRFAIAHTTAAAASRANNFTMVCIVEQCYTRLGHQL